MCWRYGPAKGLPGTGISDTIEAVSNVHVSKAHQDRQEVCGTPESSLAMMLMLLLLLF